MTPRPPSQEFLTTHDNPHIKRGEEREETHIHTQLNTTKREEKQHKKGKVKGERNMKERRKKKKKKPPSPEKKKKTHATKKKLLITITTCESVCVCVHACYVRCVYVLRFRRISFFLFLYITFERGRIYNILYARIERESVCVC